MRGTGRALAGLILLLLLPMALRLWPVEHGLPRNYLPDTHIVRSALGMAKDKNPVPEVGRYSTYPNLLPYALLPVYAVQFGAGLATGRWDGVEEYGQVVLEQPEVAHRPARYLVALLGALTPLIVFRAARAAGLRQGAWVSSWLMTTCLLHMHFSVQERPWAPLLFFLALAIWAAAVYAEQRRTKHLLLCGVAAGLAFATHQAGLPMLAVPGLAWLLGRGDRTLRTWIGQGFACLTSFALVALLLGHPYLLVHGPTAREDVAAGTEFDGGFSVGGQAVRFGLSMDSFLRLTGVFAGYDPVLLLLGLVGLWPALHRRGTRVAGTFGLLWGAFFLTNPNDHVRYLLPLALPLALAGGCTAELLGRSRAAVFALAVSLCFPLVLCMRLSWLLVQPDTRAEAESWFADLPPESVVAVDRYGPIVDLNGESLVRISAIRELGSREAHRLGRLEAEGDAAVRSGYDVIPIEDLFLFDDRRRTVKIRTGVEEFGKTPAEVLRGLGATHLLLADREHRSSDADPNLLAPVLPRKGTSYEAAPAQKFVSPGRDGHRLFYQSVRLPTEMDFPLRDLWEVDRPGPQLRLYALER